MANKRKCVICGETIEDNNDCIPYKSNRYCHSKCFNIAMKTLKKDKDDKLTEKEKTSKMKSKTKTSPRPKAELKDAMSEEEYKEKKQYYDYLRELITEGLSAKVYALSDDYIKRYNFTFKEMYQTLVYLHEIIEKELVGEVVGLIPYYYSEAKRYYTSIEQIEEQNKDIDTSNMYHEKTILIKPKQRKNKQIDITSIRKDE